MSQNAPSGGNAVNLKTGKNPPKHRSTFDLSYRFADTVRYGMVTPFFKFEGVPGDHVSLRSGHNLRTLSLKSPLMQNLRMNKDFYAVPMKALLPLNWDKLYDNPVQGDDVDPTKVNTVLVNGNHKTSPIAKLLLDLSTIANTMTDQVNSLGQNFFHGLTWLLILMDDLAAKNSLFAHFKIDPWHGCKSEMSIKPEAVLSGLWVSYHRYLEKLSASLLSSNLDTNILVQFLDASNKTVDSRYYDINTVSERLRLYYDICDNPNFVLPPYTKDVIDYNTFNATIHTELKLYFKLTENEKLGSIFTALRAPIVDASNNSDYNVVNVAPIIAYQMTLMEYFTNDKVDFIYNSDMWRQVYFTYGILRRPNNTAYADSQFIWNGSSYSYDAFSAVGLSHILSLLEGVNFSGSAAPFAVSLIHELFGFKKNLKYIDYFTGSRTRPIAVGDLNVTVNEGKVDVIDISRNIQMQRFLNQVNRIGPDAKNYLKGVFGVSERQHIDVPVKIGHIDETIYGEEVQNTADAQQTEPNSITTNLKSRGSNFAFEFNIAESTIVLGLVSFSIRRFYNNGVDPFSKKLDRFDMFNPYMQFVGDQPIRLDEISSQTSDGLIFGYTGRYAEYKNAVDYACGDFKDGALKDWIFSDLTPESQPTRYYEKISPEFIRQHPTELDRFYLNMTGTTPNERYHFIIVFDNKVEASRDMVFNPQILG